MVGDEYGNVSKVFCMKYAEHDFVSSSHMSKNTTRTDNALELTMINTYDNIR
jgi:hypothetical protein